MTWLSRWLAPLLAICLGAGAHAQTLPNPTAASASAPAPEVDELRRDLFRILREPGWDARFGLLVVSLDRGDTLVSLNPDLPLAPASNLKLFSTAAALHFLGPQFRFSTLLLADGPVRDGVLHGDLILYGTGDPSLSGRMLGSATAPLRAMVDSLRARGVREIAGDVVGDGSYFDDQRTGLGWTESDLDQWYGAPVGALSLAENMVRIQFGGGAPGEPARLRTEPATHGLAVENRVRSVARDASGVRIRRAVDRLIAEGEVRAGRTVTRALPVVDPANYAAAALRAVLEEQGVRVGGGVRAVRDARESRFNVGAAAVAGSSARVLAVHRSPTLADLAYVTNHVSHNLFADALIKATGRAAVGEGSFAAGQSAVRRMLALEAGVDSAAVRLLDGSGLSRVNRVTARSVAHLLGAVNRSNRAEPFVASLPEAGDPLGLRRMGGTAAAGRLRAKTGTIRGVSALSGYVTTMDGERLAFVILANGVPSTAREKRSEDAIGARLARFRRSP